MLQVLVERRGFPELEVAEPHVGQRLTYRPPEKPQDGGRGGLEVHVWWLAEELAQKDPGACEALMGAVPLVDGLTVIRQGPDGVASAVFRGVVVETGTDGHQVFVSAEEVLPEGSVPRGVTPPPR